MVLHHLLIELLAQPDEGRDPRLLAIAVKQVLLELQQLPLLVLIPAASEVVVQAHEFGKVAVLRLTDRQGALQRLELALEAGSQILDGHLHGVKPGEIQQITVDVPLQRLGAGVVHRLRISCTSLTNLSR